MSPRTKRPPTAEEQALEALAAEAGVPAEPITLTQDRTGIRQLAAAMRQVLPIGATGRQEEWDQIAARTLGAVAAIQQQAADAAEEREDDDGTTDSAT